MTQLDTTGPRADPQSGLAGLWTLVREQWARFPRHGPRSRSASPTTSFLRTETGKQRRREHIRGNRLLDCSFDRPAPLAGILHVTGEFIQLRILRQRGSTKIKQPG